MKKPYSLDYNIQRDTQRVAAVQQILDSLQTEPSPLELEQMGSYILYGKDEDGYNAVQRGEMTDGNKHYATFKKKQDKNLSLQSFLQNPAVDERSLHSPHERRPYTIPKLTIKRPKFNKETGEMVDPGDSEIPYMKELWESIDKFEKLLAVNEGKLPADEHTPLLPNSYRIYQLRHQLAELRKYQYFLKDSFKPVIHFMSVDRPRTQYIDWSADCFYWITYEEWERRAQKALTHFISKNINDYEVREDGMVKWVVREHTFDWENPLHVRALLNNYNNIYEYLHDRFQTYGCTLIFDFERYREMCHFSKVRNFLIDRKIQRVPYSEIAEELQITFGLKYNENYLSNIYSKQIPNAFAFTAKKNRILVETPEEDCKKCSRCGRFLPKHTIFFGVNNNRKDHFSSACKQCEKKRRIEKGDQYAYDKRTKDTTLPEMQS